MLQNAVKEARVQARLSQRQLALLAGVPASTVSRIESGAVSPTIDMLERLVDAAGFELEASLLAGNGLGAVRTARALLSDDYPFAPDPGWIERWRRLGLLGPDDTPRDAEQLLALTGAATRLTARDGLTTWSAGSSTVAEILDGLTDMPTHSDVIVTGGAAANRLLASADTRWVVLYAAEPDELARRQGWVEVDGADASATLVSVLPASPDVAAGAWEDNGLRWADPLQVVIDCYGGNGRMPDQAERILAAIGEAS